MKWATVCRSGLQASFLRLGSPRTPGGIFRYKKATMESILTGSDQSHISLMSANKHECKNV